MIVRTKNRDSPEDVVRAFNKLWIVGDIEEGIKMVAEDAVYALYLSDELLPFAGEQHGRDAIQASLEMMRAQFDYVLYRPYAYRPVGDKVPHRVEFMYRHRKSGEMLTGNFRFVMQIRDGLVVRADEYHDRAMVETFMRLFAM